MTSPSLRLRLVAVVLILLAAGLATSGVVTAAALRTYLVERIDERLERTLPIARFAATDGDLDPPIARPFDLEEGEQPAEELLVVIVDPSGEVVEGPFFGSLGRPEPPFSAVPRDVVDAASRGEAVDSLIDEERYRVRVSSWDGSRLLVLVAPLASLDATVSRLRTIELVAGVGLLALATLLSFSLVGVGLRPLRNMGEAANAIAAGDVGRRVDVRGGAEVAQLARALNAAFEARDRSEDRLRGFAADASHELRTPLSAIRGYAELLRKEAVAGEGALTAASRIESEASRLGGIVDDLLALARFDRGRSLRRELVELTLVAADAIADLQTLEPGRLVRLDADDAAVVLGDEAMLRQVVGNLLANARVHTPVSAAVHVSVRREGSDAVIDVRDEGPGISPEAVPHVFERFWRGDGAHQPRHQGVGGTGLGLAIVAAIAQAHGGQAVVVPSDGGAHLRVILPTVPQG